LTEAQMKEIFGWTQSSDMAAIYVHLSGRDVDDALLKLAGFKKEADMEKSALQPKSCPRCNVINPPTAKFCFSCSSALDMYAAMEIDNKRKSWDEKMLILVKDTEVQQLLVRKMVDMGIDGTS
jgi:integrase/recombinase XerD